MLEESALGCRFPVPSGRLCSGPKPPIFATIRAETAVLSEGPFGQEGRGAEREKGGCGLRDPICRPPKSPLPALFYDHVQFGIPVREAFHIHSEVGGLRYSEAAQQKPSSRG